MRRVVVAESLTNYAVRQHSWAADKTYRGIETGAINTNLPMIALNLRLGFRVIGSYSRSDLPRVLMFKDF